MFPRCRALGVDIATIRPIVDHADMDLNMYYLHIQVPVRQQAIDKFKEAFEGKPLETQQHQMDLFKSS